MSRHSPIANLTVENNSNIEYLKDTVSKEVTVTSTSSTLATLLGSALPDDVLGVTVLPGASTIRYNPVDAATATSGILPTVYTIFGHKTVLDTVQLYAASDSACSLIVHVPNYTHNSPE